MKTLLLILYFFTLYSSSSYEFFNVKNLFPNINGAVVTNDGYVFSYGENGYISKFNETSRKEQNLSIYKNIYYVEKLENELFASVKNVNDYELLKSIDNGESWETISIKNTFKLNKAIGRIRVTKKNYIIESEDYDSLYIFDRNYNPIKNFKLVDNKFENRYHVYTSILIKNDTLFSIVTNYSILSEKGDTLSIFKINLNSQELKLDTICNKCSISEKTNLGKVIAGFIEDAADPIYFTLNSHNFSSDTIKYFCIKDNKSILLKKVRKKSSDLKQYKDNYYEIIMILNQDFSISFMIYKYNLDFDIVDTLEILTSESTQNYDIFIGKINLSIYFLNDSVAFLHGFNNYTVKIKSFKTFEVINDLAFISANSKLTKSNNYTVLSNTLNNKINPRMEPYEKLFKSIDGFNFNIYSPKINDERDTNYKFSFIYSSESINNNEKVENKIISLFPEYEFNGTLLNIRTESNSGRKYSNIKLKRGFQQSNLYKYLGKVNNADYLMAVTTLASSTYHNYIFKVDEKDNIQIDSIILLRARSGIWNARATNRGIYMQTKSHLLFYNFYNSLVDTLDKTNNKYEYENIYSINENEKSILLLKKITNSKYVLSKLLFEKLTYSDILTINNSEVQPKFTYFTIDGIEYMTGNDFIYNITTNKKSDLLQKTYFHVQTKPNGELVAFHKYGDSTTSGSFYLTNKKESSIENEPKVLQNSYHLYPNPSSNMVNVELNFESSFSLNESEISIYDVLGLKYSVILSDVLSNGSTLSFKADCSNLPIGVYFFCVSTRNNMKKLIPFSVIK
jgi:hypothetical protein